MHILVLEILKGPPSGWHRRHACEPFGWDPRDGAGDAPGLRFGDPDVAENSICKVVLP